MNHMNIRNMMKLVQVCPHLEGLTIRPCFGRGLTDQSGYYISRLINLKRLCIFQQVFTDKTIALLSKLPLEVIEFKDCYGVASSGASTLMNIKTLKELQIINTIANARPCEEVLSAMILSNNKKLNKLTIKGFPTAPYTERLLQICSTAILK
ncbi:hypothetical protein AKO1_000215 [Acrasis kona]|uniref:Uncharacterized protein n=1 Tax=Acrasis kona TaxID=1008807 RepID=A0AAW2ZCW1_9EUKA